VRALYYGRRKKEQNKSSTILLMAIRRTELFRFPEPLQRAGTGTGSILPSRPLDPKAGARSGRENDGTLARHGNARSQPSPFPIN
jgi:hypothetical protein